MKRVWHIPVRFADYGILREAEFQADKDDYLIHSHLYEIKELFDVNAMYDRSRSVRRYAKDILSCIEDADEETSAREKFEANFRKLIFREQSSQDRDEIISRALQEILAPNFKARPRNGFGSGLEDDESYFLGQIITSLKDEFCDGVSSESDDDWDSDFRQWGSECDASDDERDDDIAYVLQSPWLVPMVEGSREVYTKKEVFCHAYLQGEFRDPRNRGGCVDTRCPDLHPIFPS